MIALLLGVALAAEPLAADPVAADPVAAWRLAGVWDLASVAPPSAEQEGWVWVPSRGMAASCGPAKAPDGLGAFEAEALSNGLSSALVVLLRRAGDGPAPGPDTLRVALGRGEPEVALEPMVEPRALAVQIEGDAASRPVQLVSTQLAMELCLEHKVGRSWTGRDAPSLRQAFLLDPPDNNRPDRKFFGGQRDPVPALLGPPDACLVGGSAAGAASPGGRGEGSLDLVPSDLWGASLRPCTEAEAPGAIVGADPRLPLRLGVDDPGRDAPRWSSLVVRVSSDADPTVDLSLDGAPLLKGVRLFPEGAGQGAALTDLVAALPRTYPTLGPVGEPGRYTLLIVPTWQVEEALARLDAGAPTLPRPRAEEQVSTAVSRVLAHPELLFVQSLDRSAGEERWLNLTEGMGDGGLDPRGWGYVAGLRAAAEPVVGVGPRAVAADAAQRAQRAQEHAMFLLCGGLVGLCGLLGLRRLADLWTPIPHERADYWPGRHGPVPTAGADAPASPAAEVVPEGG